MSRAVDLDLSEDEIFLDFFSLASQRNPPSEKKDDDNQLIALIGDGLGQVKHDLILLAILIQFIYRAFCLLLPSPPSIHAADGRRSLHTPLDSLD